VALSEIAAPAAAEAAPAPKAEVPTTDWPQYRGPNRDGHSADKGLLKQWPAGGPKLAWAFKTTGLGYSGPAVVGDKLYIMGAREDAEHLIAIDVKTGNQLWSLKLGPIFTWKGNTWNEGPSATPTVDGDSIFALSGRGDLVCASAAGKEVWRKSMTKDLKGEVNPIGGAPAPYGWGYTWSPLVDGDNLICLPGGKDGLVAALNKKNGDVVWRSKEVPEQATYSSPIVVEIGGVRQYIAMTAEDAAAGSTGGLLGVSAKDGKLLWYFHRQPPYSDCVIPTPFHH
jgi:outer membrane protein assembly factor BamB